jgi:hypothetical protein
MESSILKKIPYENLSMYEKFMIYFNIFIKYVKTFFCWEIEIKYYNPYANPVWVPYEVPVLQYVIFIVWTIFYMKPRIIGGEENLKIFTNVVMIFMVFYLLLRFTIAEGEHAKITECDIWVVQTVAFMYLLEVSYTWILSYFHYGTSLENS